MGCLSNLLILPLQLFLLTFAFFVILGLVPSIDVISSSSSSSEADAVPAPLEANHILSGAAKLFHGQLQGPETIIEHKGTEGIS